MQGKTLIILLSTAAEANIMTTPKHDEFGGALPLRGFLDKADSRINELYWSGWAGTGLFTLEVRRATPKEPREPQKSPSRI